MKNKKQIGSVKTFSGAKASQKRKELDALLGEIVKSGATTYLEIGARHGDTFFEIGKVLPKGSLMVAVDLPGGEWGVASSKRSLDNAAKELKRLGQRVEIIYDDSTKTSIVNKVKAHGDFEVVFIDGDHRYEGVKKDWLNYGIFATKLAAFHDIDSKGKAQIKNPNMLYGVAELWEELKPNFKHSEHIDAEDQPDRPMGIGIIYFEA